jgi:peroxiredoxin Q/BCP
MSNYNFKLKETDGKEISLDKYKGKNVVVYFYPKDNTPG